LFRESIELRELLHWGNLAHRPLPMKSLVRCLLDNFSGITMREQG